MNHPCKLCTNMLVVCVVGLSILRCVVALGQTETTRPDSNTSIQNAAANNVKNGKLKSEATAHERQVWETRDKMLAGRWVGTLEFGEKTHVLSVTVTTDADRVQRCLRGTYECDGDARRTITFVMAGRWCQQRSSNRHCSIRSRRRTSSQESLYITSIP